ncbi:MAG TPA: hypothetical protein VF039_06545 [Longimicrobiales bacterium]
MDVILEWEVGDVDPETIRVLALDGVANEGEGPVEVMQIWEILRLDSAGLHLRETVDDLTHSGLSRLRIEAEDRAGNLWQQVVEIDLPPMELHRTVAFGRDLNFSELASCDDGRLYLVRLRKEIIVLDDRSFDQVAAVPAEATSVICPPGMPYLLFSGEHTGRVDRRTLEVQSVYATTSGIAWTSLDPNRFYLGRTGGVNNQLMVFTIEPLAIDEWIDVFPPPEHDEWSSAVAISEHARRIFVSNSKNGVRAIDFDTHEPLDYLSSNSAYRFDSMDMQISADGGRRLYATVSDGYRLGLAIFDAQRDTALRTMATEGRPIHLGLSPSGSRVFMTTASDDLSSPNYLFDVVDPVVLQTFERDPDESGNGRYDGPVEFSADGRLLFTTHQYHNTRENFLDVYLNRESREGS